MIGLAIMLAVAAPQSDLKRTYGYPGGDQCSDWIEERKGDRQALQGWVLGFMSGFNFYGPAGGGAQDPMTAKAIVSYVDGYCDKNRLDSVLQATLELAKEVSKRRGL